MKCNRPDCASLAEVPEAVSVLRCADCGRVIARCAECQRIPYGIRSVTSGMCGHRRACHWQNRDLKRRVLPGKEG